MSLRATPEAYFHTKANVVQDTQSRVEAQVPMVVDQNVLVVLGLVALVGLLGLFAVVAGANKKCDCVVTR